MFNILLWQSVRRVLFGIFLAMTVALFLPDSITERLWVGSLFGLACPFLVLGRRRLLNREVYTLLLASLPHRRWWQFWGLTPACFTIALWSIVIARGHLALTLTFFCWGVCCVSIADLFDQRRQTIGSAWANSIVLISLFLTAPFWGALWFGRTVFSPWIASLCLGIHPTFTGLKALGQMTLQDPILYQITQSGLVEVHPLSWWSGVAFYSLISLLCLEFAVRSPLINK